MKINKYSELRDVFIRKDGVILQPTKTNKNCANCKNGDGTIIIYCYKYNCECGGNYHCKYFKRKMSA